jgi:hypothetical protein
MDFSCKQDCLSVVNIRGLVVLLAYLKLVALGSRSIYWNWKILFVKDYYYCNNNTETIVWHWYHGMYLSIYLYLSIYIYLSINIYNINFLQIMKSILCRKNKVIKFSMNCLGQLDIHIQNMNFNPYLSQYAKIHKKSWP